MVKIKDRKGNVEEAIPLLLKEEFAHQIVAGKKTIEFREPNPVNVKKFLMPAAAAAVFGQRDDLKKYAEKGNIILKNIHYLHFYNYSKTFFLDVGIEAIDCMALLPENREYFHERGCHDYDDVIDEAEKLGLTPDDERTVWFFCMPIKVVINTDLKDEIKIPIKNFDDAKPIKC